MEGFALEPYDILMLVVLLGTTVFGAWKGMAWQLTSLASVVVSAGVAVHFSKPLAPQISDHAPWNRFIAMLILYLVTSLTIWLLFRLVAGVIDRVKLKEFDRQLGGLFGLAKGVLLCLVITFFVVTLSETARQSVLGTQSGRYIALLIKNAAPVLPKEVTNVLGEYIDELDRKLDPDTPSEQTADAKPGIDEPEPGLDRLKGDLREDFDELRHGVDDRVDELRREIGEGVKDLGHDVRDRIDHRIDHRIGDLRQGINDRIDNSIDAVRRWEEENAGPTTD